jgi:polyhydroxyalkanoate synthesis regulator phasin
MEIKRKLVAGAAAALAVGGAGAGIAATQLNSSPSAESKAIVNDAAKQLGVDPTKLSDALKKALSDRIDAAVTQGRLTKQEGDALKKRIQSDEFPLFGAPPFGFRHFGGPGPHGLFHGLGAAATYLGLTEAQLRTQLNSGKTLAEIAKSQGKSVDGLEQALIKDTKTKLDAIVKEGKITKADEQKVLKDLDQRIEDLVNGQLRLRFRNGHGFGFRGFHGFPGRPRPDGEPRASFPGPFA